MKQVTIYKSFTKAEYRSLASIVGKLTWLIGLVKDIGIQVQMPVNILRANQAAIPIDANLVYHERTKHIKIDCHFVWKKIFQGLVNT